MSVTTTAVALNTTTHVETLTWPASVLGGVASTTSIAIAYTATPQQGVTHTNINSAVATGDDLTGATGNGSGAYQSNTATATAVVPTADLVITKTLGSGGLAHPDIPATPRS